MPFNVALGSRTLFWLVIITLWKAVASQRIETFETPQVPKLCIDWNNWTISYIWKAWRIGSSSVLESVKTKTYIENLNSILLYLDTLLELKMQWQTWLLKKHWNFLLNHQIIERLLSLADCAEKIRSNRSVCVIKVHPFTKNVNVRELSSHGTSL